MNSRFRGIVLSLLVLSAPAWAVDASGTWKGEVKLPSGQSVPFVAHLQQRESSVTGKLEGINGAPDVEIMDGTITGDTITFWGIRKINGGEVKFNYAGRLAGDILDIKITRADGSGAPLETLTRRVVP